MNAPLVGFDPLAVERREVFWYSLALISLTSFVAGMALLGVTRVSGYLYLISLVSGAPVLLRMDYTRLALPKAVILYVSFLAAFTMVCLSHYLAGEVDLSMFEYVARIWIGVINGFFFLALFRFDRRKLYVYIAFVAACHAAASIVVALFQGVDFTDLWFTGERVGGMTNPIPFSNMLFVSVGLVAIFVAARDPEQRLRHERSVLAAILLIGLAGVLLTGTRGTLVAVPWLLLLLAYCYRERFGDRVLVWGVVGCAVLAAGAALLLDFMPAHFMDLFDRTSSDRLRLRLWSMSWPLFVDAPLFGHGLHSVPQVFLDLGLVASDKSRLFEFNHMHNQVLDMLVKTGLVGTVAFFGSTVAAVVAGVSLLTKPRERAFALSLFWVAGAYFLFGLTSSYFAHANTILQYGVYMGMLVWLLPAADADAPAVGSLDGN